MAAMPEPVVLDRVPGQEGAMAFLRKAAVRPHHAYLLAGPEGCGKQLAVRAFAAALLCARGGCGECRDCRLALDDRHPNQFLVEPEGRDIHVDTIRSEVWHPAYRTAPEPGKKVFVIREAHRHAATGARGALDAADVVLEAAEAYRKGLKDQLEVDLAPFLDERGRPEEAYRGAIRRLEERHKRRVKRAERDYVDWVLLGVSSLLRDRVVAGVGGGGELAINLDLQPERGQGEESLASSALGLAAIEEARAALAEELNLNPRLVLERAFLHLAEAAA